MAAEPLSNGFSDRFAMFLGARVVMRISAGPVSADISLCVNVGEYSVELSPSTPPRYTSFNPSDVVNAPRRPKVRGVETDMNQGKIRCHRPVRHVLSAS